MTDIKALVMECGLNLYDIEVANENGKTIFRVYITKSGGVNLDDCEKVSKLLSPIFDVKPPVNGKYTLEVSSPGLERKLTKQDHFINSIGEKAKITTKNKEKFEGEIIGFDDEILTLKTDKENLDIKFDEILKAKTFIEW